MKSQISKSIHIEKEIIYFHPLVGCGKLVKEYNGIYGEGIVVVLANRREWFAPKNEFIRYS